MDIPRCPIHHPLVNEVASALKSSLRTSGLAPYADGPHRGVVRYVQAVVERSSRTVQVVVVLNQEVSNLPASSGASGGAELAEPVSRERLGAFADILRDCLGARLHSLWWNGNPARTNSIMGPTWERVSGPEVVHEQIGGADVFFPPGAFGQSNLDVADAVVDYVATSIPVSARVAEFYAGVGVMGLGLAKRGNVVRINEISPASLEGLRLGVDSLEPDERSRVSLFEGSAGDVVHMADGVDVVLVDPPRKGLAQELLARLVEVPPPSLVYVSCSLASFERDSSILLQDGKFKLTRLAAADFFPYTDHVETVAVFEHVRGG